MFDSDFTLDERDGDVLCRSVETFEKHSLKFIGLKCCYFRLEIGSSVVKMFICSLANFSVLNQVPLQFSTKKKDK
jgi:hypothetical protein